MLTGDNPFRRNNAVDTFTAIMREDPAPLPDKIGPPSRDVIAPILARALAKNPEPRYPTAQELASDLREARDRLVTPAGPTAAAADGSPPARTMTGVLVAAGLLALGAAAFLLLRGC